MDGAGRGSENGHGLGRGLGHGGRGHGHGHGHDGDCDPQVLRKVYFIKKAREGEELVTLLKNKFKTIDAIRDVLGWYAEGREFEIDLTDWTNGQGDPAARKEQYVVTRFGGVAAANRSIVGAIGRILNWLDAELPFDIALIPRRADGPSGGSDGSGGSGGPLAPGGTGGGLAGLGGLGGLGGLAGFGGLGGLVGLGGTGGAGGDGGNGTGVHGEPVTSLN